MGSITEFLKHIPEAATSPLAFVSYALVVAAWVVTTWLQGRPERKAQQILKLFKEDQSRLEALKALLHKDPPAGLTENESILAWVKEVSQDRKRVLLVLGLGMTLVAAIVFVVAVRANMGPRTKQVEVDFHRFGTIGDCPALPESARLIVKVSGKKLLDTPVVENCKSTFEVRENDARSATVALEGAGDFSPSDASLQYQLSLSKWNVYLTGSESKLRLRLSLFKYAGDCNADSNVNSTFQGLLQTKINSLRGIFETSDHRYDYLSGVSIVPVGQALNLNSEQIQDYWSNTSSLQVLSGLCFSKGGTEIIHSQVFSGNLNGSLPEPLVAELPLSAEEFGTTRDIHTVSVLYALAQDGIARGLDKDVVISYLSYARETALHVDDPNGQALKKAIDATLVQIGAPKPLELNQ